MNNIVLKVDQNIKTTHVGHVTTATLCYLRVLNKSWMSVCLLNYEDSEKDGDASNDNKDGGTGENNIESSKDSKMIVKKCFEQHKLNQKNYVLQVTGCSIDSPVETLMRDNVIYISQADMYNMLKQDADKYKDLRCKDVRVSLIALPEFIVDRKHYVAESMTISQISCPFKTANGELVDEVMRDFFSVPRLLGPGEIFEVKVPKRYIESLKTPPSLWFRVVDIVNKETVIFCVNESRFVSFDESALHQSQESQAHVPYCACMTNDYEDLYRFLEHPNFKAIFERVFIQLAKLLDVLRKELISPCDATMLVEAPVGFGKSMMLQSFCIDHCLHYLEQNCYDLIGDSLSATEKRIEAVFEKASKCKPCLLHLKNINVLCKDKEGLNEERRTLFFLKCKIKGLEKRKLPIIITASTHSTKDMSSRFLSLFLYHMRFENLDEVNRKRILEILFKDVLSQEIVAILSKKSSGFVLSDLIALLRNTYYSISMDRQVTENDVLKKIEEIRALKSDHRDSLNISQVRWKDVGGLEDAKKDIFETIELPIKFPNLFSAGIKRSGLLFYGPPGCGKTLLAKAIATEYTLNFYSVKGPELLNMYVGQSEENIREVFKKARRMSPCVIFFDELDSLAPSRGRQGDSGGVMDRIVSQLLAELDGMQVNTEVFIIGATNRPDLLDSALLRPGRFDKMIYVGVPDTKEERLKLLIACTRSMSVADDVDLEILVDKCPANLTGADFKALTSDATKNCFRRLIKEHEKNGKNLEPKDAVVRQSDFTAAIETCVPSVSVEELQRYERIRNEIKDKGK